MRSHASENQAWRRLPCSVQRTAVSATTSAADHSSVPSSCRLSCANFSSVQFALDSSRSKSRTAFLASPSVTPLPRKRSSSRCKRRTTCSLPSTTSPSGAELAPNSRAIRSNSSLHSSWWCPSAMRTVSLHLVQRKGLRSVKTLKHSSRPLNDCFCRRSTQPRASASPPSPAPRSSSSSTVTTSRLGTAPALASSLLSALLSSSSATTRLRPPLSPLLLAEGSVSAACGATGRVDCGVPLFVINLSFHAATSAVARFATSASE
mmetsp:Transcript_39288/g.108328  ORF Transcript_39288/g.108328 Transcript_39288/m.108328 type:complete len:263 (+) Transcript_39288:998-1786(+)